VKDRTKQHEPVVYLDLQPSFGVTVEDVLAYCRIVQDISRKAYMHPVREVIDRLEYAPGIRPLRVRIVLADDATAEDAYTLRVTLEPYSDTEPTYRRGRVATA